MLQLKLKDQQVNGFVPFRALNLGEASLKTATEAQAMPIGEVALVRSASLPNFGPHYIVVTGHPVVKEHGMRPQTLTIPTSPENSQVLNQFPKERPLVLLQLDKTAKEEFYNFYGLELNKDGVALKVYDHDTI